MPTQKKSVIQDLLFNQKTGVLATQSMDYPYTSVIAFVVQKDLKTIMFITKRKTQKYRNIQSHDKISLMIDNRTDTGTDFSATNTLTVLGRTCEVDKESYKKWFVRHHPQLHEFLDDPDCTMMKIEVDLYVLVEDFQKITTIHSNGL